MKQGIIQLQGTDGDDIALFEFDQDSLSSSEAIARIETQMELSRDEESPLDAAEEELEKEGIRRIYVTDYANTDVL